MDKKVSIVIPVYNCEKYLSACLNSLLCQTYKNMEIILVDDGSSDKSPALCDEYAERHMIIKVIHQKNAGPGAARNAGMNIVTGEYLTFVDADDYVSKKYVEILVELLEKYQAGIAEVGLVCMYQSHNAFEKNDEKILVLQGHENLVKDYFSENRKLRNCIAGRMYDLQGCRDVRFSSKSIGEDTEFSLRMLSRCERLVKYNKCLYGCRAYQETLTRKPFNPKNFEVVRVAYQDLQFAQRMGVDPDNWEYVFRHFTEICYDILRKIAVQKQEKNYRAELQEMLCIYGKMSLLAEKHNIHLDQKLIRDTENIEMWAREYRKKNRRKIKVKNFRSLISKWLGNCKEKISYEYKFED